MRIALASLLAAGGLLLGACAGNPSLDGANASGAVRPSAPTAREATSADASSQLAAAPRPAGDLTLEEVPAWSGTPSVEVFGNVPDFTEADLTTNTYLGFSELDGLGRAGRAVACLGTETVPMRERGSISEIRPSGWHSVTYDVVEGGSLYNRCHLIAHELCGVNADERNLITGTRYLNVDGMLPFENRVTSYIVSTGNHVLYRVTPLYQGSDLVARGVQMEALSVEDGGAGIRFNVFAYNVQPGIGIDYATGASWRTGEAVDGALGSSVVGAGQTEAPSSQSQADEGAVLDRNGRDVSTAAYVLNTRSMRFHRPDCDSVRDMKQANRLAIDDSREEIVSQGYRPCGRCNP